MACRCTCPRQPFRPSSSSRHSLTLGQPKRTRALVHCVSERLFVSPHKPRLSYVGIQHTGNPKNLLLLNMIDGHCLLSSP